MSWKNIAGIAAAMAVGSIVAIGGCTDMNATQSNAKDLVPRQATITVDVNKPGAAINPAMWGAFFEDINFGADGGLYAEMVKNRAFEFPEPFMGWTRITTNVSQGDITIQTTDPWRPTQPHYVRINSKSDRLMGLSNEGFRGMGVKAGEAYDFSTAIRVNGGSPRIRVEIVGEDGTTLATGQVSGWTGNWGKATATLVPKVTDPNARLAVMVEGTGTVDMDMVSLFPEKTWKNRPGGLRTDMVQMLADMHPGFLRFPGGCIVEGSILANRYQWKNTIGPVEDRKLLINRWNVEFPWRPTPDYYQSFGLGFYEYFQLCEDIGAQPLPLLNCGMACEFNSNELCPVDDLGPYIQDALDLIEFANGPADSTWGAKRAAMGHPAPFGMKMMGIGNEQWGPQYIERLSLFTKAIKEKHPEISLVSAAGPSPSDDRFEYLWPKLRELKADIVDEHCYANPLWFLANSDRYDNYDRNGPKVFFGEYAAQSVAICSTKNRNNLECALSEAAYMTGLERNAEVVRMASYAPLFANIDAWQWTPDLMWTNSLQIMPTPNYFVQQMYAKNRGDVVLPVTNTAPVRQMLPKGRIGLGTFQTSAEFKDVRVEHGSSVWTADFSSDAAGWTGGDTWKTADGAYRQIDLKGSVTSYAGDKEWSDYTLTLKARKLDGAEGFIITVYDDGAGANVQWLLGGWGNKQHGILTHYAEQDQLLERVPGTIEANRWYDIKVVAKAGHIDCYLDGKLLQSSDVLKHRVPELFTTAVRDNKTNEVILKVVNPGDAPMNATVQLRGLTGSISGTATVLTGNLSDENSFEKTDFVAPSTTRLPATGPELNYTFKPRSFTVLRLGE